MATTIHFNASKMFDRREPWDVSNSIANLGPRAAELTWSCAREVARTPPKPAWLLSSLRDAVEGLRDHFRSYGAWDAEEIAAWTDQDILAMFVQEVANDLRMLGSDDRDLAECVRVYRRTDWDKASEYPHGSYYRARGQVFGTFYAGM